MTTADEPVPLTIPLPTGGYFVLEATARDADRAASRVTRDVVLRARRAATPRGSATITTASTSSPERKTYKPGDTARIMIQSPWEQATALVTTEREGIRTHRQFALTSTQQSIDDPDHRGRHPERLRVGAARQGPQRAASSAPTRATARPDASSDPSDPGKPSFRLGYVELQRRGRVASG